MSEWDGGVSWEHSNGTCLVFVQVEEKILGVQNNRQGCGLNHIAYKGGSLSQLDELQLELEARKIKILKRVGTYLCFEDSNHFAVEIYAHE